MHTNSSIQIHDWKYKSILWAQIFLFLGVLSSPTIVSLFHILIIIPTIAFWLNKPKDFSLPKSAWVLIALFMWGGICTAFNYDTIIKPSRSFNDLKYYLFGVLLILPIYHFYKQAKVKHIRIFLNIFWIVIIVGFFVGISRSTFQFDPVKFEFTDRYHPYRSGGFLNYMRYGYASAFVSLLGLSVLFNKDKLKSIINFKLFLPALVLSLCAIYFSQTRGALLALMVGVPFVLWRFKRNIAILSLAVGGCLVLVIIYFSFFGNTNNRLLNIAGNSNKVRMSQFQTALKVIETKPFFGLGADQFSYNVIEYKKKYNLPSKHYSGHAHNIFLEHGANFGVLGIALLALFLMFWFFEMIAIHSSFGWAVASYILAFTISGQVELLFDNANSHILFFIYSFSLAIKKMSGKGRFFEEILC
ncbi:MAG: hypothetical protein CME62_08920 [Halobacteriovoraceae bacterium]|nr:hypothetical protein [Halobacteriovoraceae bacterium]|tara:strand:- start:12924 stop:14168 length:1245 start_codon:yes stop_codon:yes gene_type:complete